MQRRFLWFLALPALLAAAAPASPLKDVLQPFVDRHEVAGAVVLVADRDRVLAEEATGFADIAAGTPMRADTTFWIASMSKAMTAAALMMLVDEGKVDADAPVEKYLPEFKGQWLAAEQDAEHVLLRKPKHPITVRNILSHTSGLPFKSALEEPTLDGLPLCDAVRSYAMTPLQFEPDRKYQYSNAGINTAGRIIEVASGLSYEAFLQQRLFDPLGMKDTTFWPTAAQVARLARSYRPNKAKDGLEAFDIGQLKYPLDGPGRHPMPAGGLFSTAADVARFCRLLLGDGMFEGRRLLSEASVKQMTSRQTAPDLKESYGFGLSCGDGWFGHGGAHATDMTVNRAKNLITVYMVQHAGFPGEGKQCLGAFKKAAEQQFGAK